LHWWQNGSDGIKLIWGRSLKLVFAITATPNQALQHPPFYHGKKGLLQERSDDEIRQQNENGKNGMRISDSEWEENMKAETRRCL
jgi:hypothetical protein